MAFSLSIISFYLEKKYLTLKYIALTFLISVLSWHCLFFKGQYTSKKTRGQKELPWFSGHFADSQRWEWRRSHIWWDKSRSRHIPFRRWGFTLRKLWSILCKRTVQKNWMFQEMFSVVIVPLVCLVYFCNKHLLDQLKTDTIVMFIKELRVEMFAAFKLVENVW